MRRLVKIHSAKVSVVELESTNLVLAMNKLVIMQSFFSHRGVKPMVREATQNSSHLKGRPFSPILSLLNRPINKTF